MGIDVVYLISTERRITKGGPHRLYSAPACGMGARELICIEGCPVSSNFSIDPRLSLKCVRFLLEDRNRCSFCHDQTGSLSVKGLAEGPGFFVRSRCSIQQYKEDEADGIGHRI